MDTARITDALRGAWPDLTDAEVSAALTGIDTTAVETEETSRFAVELWDRQTPINGVPAERIIARDDVPDEGDIYLVYRDGQLVIFQPHDPNGGPIPTGQGQAVADTHVAAMAADAALSRVTELVRPKIAESRASQRTADAERIATLEATVDQLVLDSLMGGLA